MCVCLLKALVIERERLIERESDNENLILTIFFYQTILFKVILNNLRRFTKFNHT